MVCYKDRNMELGTLHKEATCMLNQMVGCLTLFEKIFIGQRKKKNFTLMEADMGLCQERRQLLTCEFHNYISWHWRNRRYLGWQKFPT